ncbi:NAD(P)-dependent oxidoreductase [Mycobacterium sp. Y57]|uniref:NAD(P)-dependent oxidoreductase n=1 Tax=Mycolicibacterium xanthum TaxID=2796469 RepID=UPI001C85DD7C|nr:NAD(P)-dependent oxidoreductase [Mycolicibacterium xanthum]MBX7432282.1 NAD(P)-dependent oxidoreductase [Mycolicibacterium xanthum]
MTIGFIGLGNMGFPMAARLLAAGHRVIGFDTRAEAIDRLVGLGAEGATSVAMVGARADTVLASLPRPDVSRRVVADLAAAPGTVNRFVDLSTVGAQTARLNARALAGHGIAAFDSPVSGGVSGAENGSLALMVSGPAAGYPALEPLLQTLGRPFFVGETPGAGQTMKLVNNLLAATALAATAEAMAMGVKAGLDAQVMLDVLNAGSGGTHASRDKFPRAVLPRTFDYGFATGLMVKDVRLYLQEAEELGTLNPIATAVGALWEDVLAQQGPDSDFTTVVKRFEEAAGVVVQGR